MGIKYKNTIIYSEHDIVLDYFNTIGNNYQLLPWILKPFTPQTTFYKDTNTTIFTWNPLGGVEDLLAYTYYIGLVNRIDYLDYLLTIVKTTDLPENNTLIKILTRWQDEMQILTLYMEKTSLYRDDQILHPIVSIPACKWDKCKSIYDNFPVARESVFDIEALPDTTVHILNCQIWGTSNTNESDKNLPFTSKLDYDLMMLLSKTIPTACKSREFSKVFKNKISQYYDTPSELNILVDIFRRILTAGFLGIYDKSTVVANFERRRSVYSWYCFSNSSIDEFLSWMKVHKSVTIYIIREYLFFMIQSINPLYDYMNEHYKWESIEKSCILVCDNIRYNYNVDIDDIRDVYYDNYSIQLNTLEWKCEIETEIFNKLKLKTFPRFKPISVVDKIISTINTIVLNRILEKDDKLSIIDITKETNTIKFCINNFYEYCKLQNTVSTPFSFEWMFWILELNIKQTIIPFKNAVSNYFNELNRRLLFKTLSNIYNNNPKDFKILQTFYNELYIKENFIIYNIPDMLKNKQLEAYCKLYSVDSITELPPDAGQYYYCSQCGTFKSYIYSRNLTNNQNSISHFDICYDLLSEKLYCKSLYTKFDIPDNYIGAYQNSKNPERKIIMRQERHRKNKTELEACMKQELTPVNMIGKLIATPRQGLIIICPACGLLTSLIREGINCDDPNVLYHCGCQSKKESTTINCTICAKVCLSYIKLTLYDDESTEDNFIHGYICQKCSQYNKFDNKIYLLSYIHYLYSKRFKKFIG